MSYLIVQRESVYSIQIRMGFNGMALFETFCLFEGDNHDITECGKNLLHDFINNIALNIVTLDAQTNLDQD